MVEVPEQLKGRDFTRMAAWSPEDIKTVLDLADELKERQRNGARSTASFPAGRSG